MLALAGIVAVCLWTQRRALGAFFSLDDLRTLEAVTGITHQSQVLWRFLSVSAYFSIADAVFQMNPLPYHALNLALHALNTVLVYGLVRARGGSRPASAIPAIIFGSSRFALPVLFQAVTINELLSFTFLMLAMLAELKSQARGHAPAIALFAIALLCKETAVAIPLALLVAEAPGMTWKRRFVRTLPLILVSIALVGYAALRRGSSQVAGGEAYEMAIGANVFHNLMTYTSWVFDFKNPMPDLLGGISATAWHVGAVEAAALLTVGVMARGPSRLALFGLVWWLLALVPVLPLLHHSYAHYLYSPVAGLALMVGGLWEWAAHASTRPWPNARRALQAVVLVAVIGYVMRSDVLMGERVAARMRAIDLPLDPVLRKSAVALNAVRSLGPSVQGRTTRLVFLIPTESGKVVSATTGREARIPARARAPYGLFEECTDHGRVLRLFFPGIDSVAFVGSWDDRYRDFELCTNTAEGVVANLGRGPEAYAQAGTILITNGYDATAREYLAGAVAAHPDELGLRFIYALALYRTGSRDSSLAQLHYIVRTAPDDPVSGQARTVLSQLPAQ